MGKLVYLKILNLYLYLIKPSNGQTTDSCTPSADATFPGRLPCHA